MIVKLREPLKWQRFESNIHAVKAIRLNVDFLFETKRGWQQGHKGQWLIEIGESMRCAIDDESFQRQYKPAED